MDSNCRSCCRGWRSGWIFFDGKYINLYDRRVLIMMRTVLLIAILLTCLGFRAQGNLQFNQVLLLNNGTTYTVPVGKVWKLEGAVFNSYSITYNNSAKLVLNGTTVEVIPFSFNDGNGTSRAPMTSIFPFWLPQNTTIQPTQAISRVSVIEFNILP